MPSPIAPLLLLSFVLAGLGGQITPDETIADTRVQLEAQRRALLANIADQAWMQDSARAAIVRRSIEQGWQKCASNEAAALAKASERPARLLAEAAVATCQPWEKAYVSALDRGAYPYVTGLVSREDMVADLQLQSRDAAVARILMWRGVSSGSAQAAPATPSASATPKTVNRDLIGSSSPSVLLRPYPKTPAGEPPAAAAAKPETPAGEAEIVVVAKPRNICEVRFADRTLSESELATRARQWAATGTPLRIVRPRGATYGCLVKITRALGEYGLRFFQVVEP